MIESARQRPVGDIARHFVGGESKRAVTVEIAGKLVGDQDQGQRAGRVLFPLGKLTRCCLRMQGRKPVSDGGIEGRIGGEPALRPRFPPEGDDVLRFSGA